MCDEVRLVRHDLGETPWGFRITGGRDFGTPLLVVKVVGGSIAALAGVQVGDLVRGINYVPTNDFTHLDAQRAILESGDTLILNLLKGGEYEQYYQPEPLPAFSLPEPVPPPPVPAIPVIDIQSPEDKEVEEIGQQEVSEDLELAFVIHLDRSGRISAVEELPTPSTTPRTTPTSRRTSSTSGDKRRKSSGSSSGKTPSFEDSEKKSKVSVSVHDNGPINIQPPSYEDATRNSKSREKKESSKHQEVTLHEEMRVETSTKKTTTEIKERTEEEFIMGVRDQIVARAHKEKRELTEEEIAEMMAGEAEVIEASKGKEVIGVNFQKFMPKCDFIKDSEVFKVLQEEQIKKEKSEEEQLEKDPLKRFSKFLIKPKTAVPIEKPKPIHPEPMAWQQRLNASVASDKKTTALTESATAVKTNEVHKEGLKTEQGTINENKQIEERTESDVTENITLSTFQESDENLTIKIQKSEKQEYNEVIRRKEEEEVKTDEVAESSKVEEELESIDWKEEKSDKQKESIGVLSNKRSSLEDGRRSKTKKVGFVGLQFKEDIEKQLAEIQKELLTLQRLPIEIQNHLLVVQQSLQDIVAQRSQMQTPVDDDEKIEATEVYRYNVDGDDEEGEIVVKKDDATESIDKDDKDESKTTKHESHHEEISISKQSISNVEESKSITSSFKSEQYESTSSSSHKEVNDEVGVQEKEDKTFKEIKNKTEEKNQKDLPHGQEDVEICESTVKPALPLTPQLRPIQLPGGRKWAQPRDAYTEEFIAETLVSQSEVLVGTTIGVNFRKYIPPKFDTSNSAVYRLIHDIEEKTKKGVAERPEKVFGLEEFYHPPIDKRHFYAAELAEKKHVDNLNKEQYSGPAHH